MNIADNYVDMFISSKKLNFNVLILYLQTPLRVIWYELVNDISIYSVYDQVKIIDIFYNYVDSVS